MTTKRELLNHNFAQNEVDFENAALPDLSTEYQRAMESAGYEFASARVSRRGRTLGFHVAVTPREWAVRQSEEFEANNAKEAAERSALGGKVLNGTKTPTGDDFTGKKDLLLKLLNELLSESHI